MQISSLRDKSVFDLEFTGKGVIGLCELKYRGDAVHCYWWLSGLTVQGRASLLLQAQTALPASTEREALPQARELLAPLLKIARKSMEGGGIKTELLLPQVSTRQSFALAHLRLLDSQGLLGAPDDIYVRASRQYQLCDSLGVSNLVETIAAFENAPLSATRKRIQRAREAGLLERRREQEFQK